jgi:hypothetical protein
MEENRHQGKRRRFIKRTTPREEKIRVSTDYPLQKYRVLAEAVSSGSLPPFAALLRKTLNDTYDRLVKVNGKSDE